MSLVVAVEGDELTALAMVTWPHVWSCDLPMLSKVNSCMHVEWPCSVVVSACTCTLRSRV